MFTLIRLVSWGSVWSKRWRLSSLGLCAKTELATKSSSGNIRKITVVQLRGIVNKDTKRTQYT